MGAALAVGAAPEVQVPNAVWHPAAQWSVLEPHHPYCEQQVPKEEPWQVKPEVEPQLPSVETFLVGVLDGGLELWG